jgi:large subunit ribosomal protein L35
MADSDHSVWTDDMTKRKIKTHKGLAKRVRVSSKGKIKRRASYGGHLMSGKGNRRRRRVTGFESMGQRDTQRTLKALAGYRP